MKKAKEHSMNEIFMNQLALDFCCSPREAADEKNHFTVYSPLEGRRRFREEEDCCLKMAVVGGKLLCTGKEQVVEACQKKLDKEAPEWLFDAEGLMKIAEILRPRGYRIKAVHPFFLPSEAGQTEAAKVLKRKNPADEIRFVWYEKEQIEQFRGDERFTNAYSFCETAPDVLGIAAVREGEILGMAGASADSETMWQIGIDIVPAYRRGGIAVCLVTMLKEEIIRRGALPFYGTAMSHIGSQRVAVGSGFVPAWAELVTTAEK